MNIYIAHCHFEKSLVCLMRCQYEANDQFAPYQKISEIGQICRSFDRAKAKKVSSSAGASPLDSTRSSAPGPHRRLRPQTPIAGRLTCFARTGFRTVTTPFVNKSSIGQLYNKTE